MAIRLTKDFRLFASEDPLTIDIDNDTDAIAVDNDNNLREQVSRETNVSLYYGTTKQSISTLSAKVYKDAALTQELASSTTECNAETGNVRVNIPAGNIPDSLYVNISASCGYGSRDIVFTIIPQVAGKAGETPVIYQLAPSETALPFDRTDAGTLSERTYDVALNVKRTEGNNSTIISELSGYKCYVGFDAVDYENPIAIGQSVTVNNSNIGSHTSLCIELWKGVYGTEGAKLQDRETLPITRDGRVGNDSVRLDLDNETDSMLYNGSGELVSGSAVTIASLYLAAKPVTSGITYTKEDHDCVSSIVSNDNGTATVTVTSLTATDGYVIINAEFGGHTYSTRFTLHKLVGVDKYDLAVTPSAVGVNDTTSEATADAITIQVYRTKQNGTRSLLQSLPSGFVLQVKPYAGGGSTTITPEYSDGYASVSVAKNHLQYVINLLDASNEILDTETVPINHVVNGANPDVWTIGADGYWYLNGVKQDTLARGSNGQAVFVSYMFCRSKETPTSKLTTEGSFANPSPTHSLWKDTVPSGADPVYLQTRVFTSDGQSPQEAQWKEPSLLADTSDVDVCFHDAMPDGGKPSDPLYHFVADQGNGWKSTGTENSVWMAVSKKTGGSWSGWSVTKIKGEKGDPGDPLTYDELTPEQKEELRGASGATVSVQYSPDKSTTHTTYQSGDKYMRTKLSTDSSWGAWVQIEGENGAPGPHTDYAFAYSSSLSVASVTTPPTGVSTWYDTPPAAVPNKYLWVRVTPYTLNANNVLVAGTVTYARLSGQDGETAFILDIDNEMTSIPVGADGKTEKQIVLSFGLSCFYGTRNILSDCTVSLDGSEPSGITVDVSTKSTPVITIASGTQPAEITELTFKAVHATYGTRRAVFSIAAVKSGGQGQDAEIQELMPSLSQLSFARDTDGTTFTPVSRTLTCKIKKTKGASVIEQTISASGLTVRYSTSSMPASKTAGTSFTDSGITIQSSTTATNVYIAAFNAAGTIVDRETIPVVKDGSKGDKGDDAVNVNISTLNVVAHKSTSAKMYYVGINVNIGDTQLEYGDEYTGFSCSVLSSDADYSITDGLKWRFDIPDSNHFRYKLKLAENAVVNTDIPFTVTVKGKVYEYVIHFSTVEDGKQGDPGEPGKDGNGIASVTTHRKYTPTLAPPTANESGWIASTATDYPSSPVFSDINHYLWEKRTTTYTKSSNVDVQIILVATFDSNELRPQLLLGTAFDSEDTMTDFDRRNGSVVPEAFHGQNAWGFMPSSNATYYELLNQVVYRPGDISKIQSNQWYTLSFYSRDRKMVNEASNKYGFADHEIFLMPGTYRLQMNGHCSATARAASTPVQLNGYIFNDDWTKSISVGLTTTEDSTVTSSVITITTAGLYHVKFYAYKSSGVGGNDGETVRINWFRIICETRTDASGNTLNGANNTFATYIHPSALDTSGVRYVDGRVISSLNSDGCVLWNMADDEPDSEGWTRHWVSFKTKNAITATSQNVLFRVFGSYTEVAAVKLERGIMPTAWCEHTYDSHTECSHNPCGKWVPNNTYYYCNGQRDVVRAKASAEGGDTWWRMKRRTTSAGYVSKIEPFNDTEHWERGNNLKFSIVDAMFAEEVITDKLTVTKFYSTGDNSHIEMRNGVAEFFGVFAFPNIRVGVDSSGCSILEFYGADGQKMYDLGPNGLSKIDTNAASFAEIRLMLVKTSLSASDAPMVYNLIKKITKNDTTAYYQFSPKRTTTGTTTVYWYGGTSHSSAPSETGKCYQSKALGYSGSTEDLPTGSLIPDGWYAKQNDGRFPLIPTIADDEVGSFSPSRYRCQLYYYSSGKQTKTGYVQWETYGTGDISNITLVMNYLTGQ